LQDQLRRAIAKREAAPPGEARDQADASVEALITSIERSVAVYVAINLRTDGKSIVMAQKVEAPRKVEASWTFTGSRRRSASSATSPSTVDRRDLRVRSSDLIRIRAG